MIDVSICMCSYRRADLLKETLKTIARRAYPNLEVIVVEDGFDGGWTRGACEEFGARYFIRKNRPRQPYSNPAIPWNCAIKQAEGDVLILQNPECAHVAEDVIDKLIDPHRSEPNRAIFANVLALQPDGLPWQWYCHPIHSPRPLFFCGSVRRATVLAIGGFEEDFGRGVGGYGYDDDWFAFCLNAAGVKFVFRSDAEVHHRWHQGTDCYGLTSNEVLFNAKVKAFLESKTAPVANVGRAWGSLDS